MADSRGVLSDAETVFCGGLGGDRDGLMDVDLSQSFAYTSGTLTITMDSTEVSKTKVLSRDMIQAGLSQIGCASDGTKVAYLHLSLSELELKDITILTSYNHLQYLDLSRNSLRDLSVLSCIPNLHSLNASYNRLTKLLDFTPPHNLTYVDYSYNEIETIPDLSTFDSINVLNLDGNQIIELTGLSDLHSLTTLTVSDNRIERIQGLDNLPLKHLNLSGNSISVIVNVNVLKLLQVVNLSGNQIQSLKGLCGQEYLREINMEDNQVVELNEVLHLSDLQALDCLNLKKNPIQTLPDYKQVIMNHLSSLLRLDGQLLTVEEKIAAKNRQCSPIEITIGHNHLQLMCKAARKPTRLNFSTLTHVDEPYPMLVLCGPSGSAKGIYAQSLIEEFSSFFGLGVDNRRSILPFSVSHTTRPQGSRESHGRDYYFINEATFKRASEAGEFIQMCEVGDYWYGLTMAAIEQIAQQGLACVTHMTLEGVLSMKRSHFDPRYILMLPLTSQIHQQRLHTKSHVTEEQVIRTLNQVQYYQEFHQQNPGFFDATINTDSLQDGYNMLQSIVMAYGGISPETPLTLSLSASRPTTQHTSTSVSTFDLQDTSIANSGVVVPPPPPPPPPPPLLPSISSAPIPILAQPWSRPSSSGSGIGCKQGVKKSASDQVVKKGKVLQIASMDIIKKTAR